LVNVLPAAVFDSLDCFDELAAFVKGQDSFDRTVALSILLSLRHAPGFRKRFCNSAFLVDLLQDSDVQQTEQLYDYLLR
jgi:hypothetical protein